MWASHLTRGSSPVDWCEDNYSFSPLIGMIQKLHERYMKEIKYIIFLITFIRIVQYEIVRFHSKNLYIRFVIFEWTHS